MSSCFITLTQSGVIVIVYSRKYAEKMDTILITVRLVYVKQPVSKSLAERLETERNTLITLVCGFCCVWTGPGYPLLHFYVYLGIPSRSEGLCV